VRRPFYNPTTASVNITDVIIDDRYCTVKGTFAASENVTDVVVRFLRYPETSPGGSSGYTSVAFVTKPQGNNFEITIPIEELSHRNYNFRVFVTILMENGVGSSTLRPVIYRLVNTGTGFTLETDDILNDGTWEVTVSHQPARVDYPNGSNPQFLVDGNTATFLSMIKPGRTFDGITVPADDVVWATVNFNRPMEFNTVVLTNRNANAWLNTQAVSFHGSNDGIEFIPIELEIDLPNPSVNVITLDNPVTFRYLKMTYDRWDTAGGNTMQFSELGLRNVR
jgi:hypothetical protein